MSIPAPAPRSGGQILVDQLLIHGADTAFCVPGESYLDVLNALYDVPDRIRLINARHEAGAAVMAEAYGKLTGRPGIAMVTRGPGACHASVGVHVAHQDSTPMILLVGQVARSMLDREAFQEVDYRAMFAPLAKWVAQIEDPARIPEYMARAFRVATSGRPGPVVLALPEDMLTDEVSVSDAATYAPTVPQITEADADQTVKALRAAERPLVIAGGSGWDDGASAALTHWAETAELSVACSFRRQDIVPTVSRAHVGELGLAGSPQLRQRVAEADLLLVIGARLGEITTQGYETLVPGAQHPRLIHIHPDPDELGRVYAPTLGIVANPCSAALGLAARPLSANPHRRAWTAMLRAEFLADTVGPTASPDGALDMGIALCALRDDLPTDAIVTVDAGNHTGWPQRYLRFGRPGRLLGSTCGSMGYAVPAAVAASLRDPDRLALACVGDGGFMMSGNELATAAQHGARPIVLLFNNRQYGTIRMHQAGTYPKRVVGTDLVHTDLCQMAEGLGAFAQRVTRTEEFAPAFAAARAADRPAVIELMTEPAQITTRHRLENGT